MIQMKQKSSVLNYRRNSPKKKMKKSGNWNTTAEYRQGMEDPRRYNNDKLRLWIQAYTLAWRKLSRV